MSAVRLLADDLTGALDAGACFAREQTALPVCWTAPPAKGGYAVDSETREALPDVAAEAVARLAPLLAASELAFKKIDSLLRGNTAAEIAACLRSGSFASAVIAPAFPAQGRITRGGRQFIRNGGAWSETSVRLDETLAEHGLKLRRCMRGQIPCGAGWFLCDAESQDDLAALAGAAEMLTPPILWCGSAGLASALVGPLPLVAPPRAPALLAIVGSNHPVSTIQVARISRDIATVVDEPENDAAAAARIAARLAAGLPACLIYHVQARASDRLGAVLERVLPILPRPGALFTTGGYTAFQVCRALGTQALAVAGWIAPGTPLSRLTGGIWPDMPFVTKSGAFGEAEMLAELIARISGGTVERA